MNAIVAAIVLAAACGADEPVKATERIVFRTSGGDFVVALYADAAPQHAVQMLQLARLGAFDGVPFTRLQADFILQSATVDHRPEPLTDDQFAALRRLPAEGRGLKHLRGRLTMARDDDDPDSGTSSFCILLADAPHLDGQYTVFGEVERGWPVIEYLARTPTTGDRPRSPLTIDSAVVVGSLDELGLWELAPAPSTPADDRHGDAADGPERLTALMLGVLTIGGVALFFLSYRLTLGQVRSLLLVGVFIAFFGWLTLVTPWVSAMALDPADPRLWAGGVFLAVLGLLWLMGWFESPEK